MVALLLPYVLPLVLVVPISLYLFFFLLGKNGYGNTKNLPPGSKGWPLLGENLEFAFLGPQKFIKDRMDKYSPIVFKTSLVGEKVVILCGVQGNKFLFSSENKHLTTWWPKSVTKPFLFPEFVESNFKDVLTVKDRFYNEIFKPEALKQYIPVMDALAREQMDNDWMPHSVVKVVPLSRKYTFELACKVFLSVTDPEHIKKLGDPFSLVTNGMFSVPIDLPGTAYNRALKGGKKAREELMNIIKKRRKELIISLMHDKDNEEIQGGRDLLSKMLLVKDEHGQFLSEMEVSNNIIGLLVASFETTSNAITSVMNHLASLPHICEQVFKEQLGIAKSKGPNELLTWEDIEKMKYSWNVARESLRLTPPALGAFRETTSEFTYAGFTIPKGWKMFWTVHSSHKNPEYFPDPEKFDPSRFEGSGPAPYTFVPFGGGRRMCRGKEYARLEVLVFMHNVVRRFELEKAIPNEKIVFNGFPTPVHGLPVCLKPRAT